MKLKWSLQWHCASIVGTHFVLEHTVPRTLHDWTVAMIRERRANGIGYRVGVDDAAPLAVSVNSRLSRPCDSAGAAKNRLSP